MENQAFSMFEPMTPETIELNSPVPSEKFDSAENVEIMPNSLSCTTIPGPRTPLQPTDVHVLPVSEREIITVEGKSLEEPVVPN